MPTNSIAHVHDRLLVRSLAVGSGGVGKWRTVTTRVLLAECIATAPVGNPLDALHRAEKPGRYKAAFRSDHRGTKGKRFIGRVTNNAPHARYVEEGRGASGKPQFFSWSRIPGSADWYVPDWFDRTRAREGLHIMEKAGERIALRRHAAWHDRSV